MPPFCVNEPLLSFESKRRFTYGEHEKNGVGKNKIVFSWNQEKIVSFAFCSVLSVAPDT